MFHSKIQVYYSLHNFLWAFLTVNYLSCFTQRYKSVYRLHNFFPFFICCKHITTYASCSSLVLHQSNVENLTAKIYFLTELYSFCYDVFTVYISSAHNVGVKLSIILWINKQYVGLLFNCLRLIFFIIFFFFLLLLCIIFSSTGRRPESLCHGSLSIVHRSASIHLCVNFFFKHLL